MIYATWCISNNIGDALTPWLIRRITGETPVYVPFDVEFPKYMVTGSVLNHATDYTVVWGAGYANGQDTTPGRPGLVKALAVRGPTTLHRLNLQAGIPADVIGDPALLLPQFYTPNVPERQYKVGICPHYVHQQEVAAWIGDSDEILLINVFDTPEQFADDLCSCDVVYSSSLHGLIVADAYGKPSQWIEGTAALGGDGSKFNDHLIIRDYLKRYDMDELARYCLRVECMPPMAFFPRPHLQQLPRDVDKLRDMIIDNAPPDFTPLTEKLWAVCPFRPDKPEKVEFDNEPEAVDPDTDDTEQSGQAEKAAGLPEDTAEQRDRDYR